MALFDNVNYTFYCDTLGRSAVPDEAAFKPYVLENCLYVKSLIDDGLLAEKAEDGFDSAVCMMIEEDYKYSLIESGQTAVEASESIGGYSYSANTKAYDVALEKNSRSLAEKKYRWLALYCHVLAGVK